MNNEIKNLEKFYIKSKINTINHFFLKYSKQKKYIIIKKFIIEKLTINYKCKSQEKKDILFMFNINPKSKRIKITEESNGINKIYYSIKSLKNNKPKKIKIK